MEKILKNKSKTLFKDTLQVFLSIYLTLGGFDPSTEINGMERNPSRNELRFNINERTGKGSEKGIEQDMFLFLSHSIGVKIIASGVNTYLSRASPVPVETGVVELIDFI